MSVMKAGLSRTASAMLAACLLTAVLLSQHACARHPSGLKHVIFFIGDGMSAASEIAASRYLYGKDDGLAWHNFPAKAYVATWDVNVYNGNARRAGRPPYSRSSCTPRLGYDVLADGAKPRVGPDAVLRFPPGPAAESASAATAMATGFKTDAGNVAWLPGDPPGGALTTIAEEFRSRSGAGIGIVSTVPFDHATPASFVSHNVSRSSYYSGLRGYAGLGIADEIILQTKPDVVIGGGHPHLDNPAFDTKRGYISEALYRGLQGSRDYIFVERRLGQDGGRAIAEGAAAAAREGRKLFGLFGGKGGSFESPFAEDRPGFPRVIRTTGEDPSLAEAATAALDYLGRDPDGFFLIIEQGDIDWSNHDNDFRAMVGGVADLDESVRSALAFVDRPGDAIDWTNTVLLVTADHATGGLWLEPGRALAAGDLPLQDARLGQVAVENRGTGVKSAGTKPFVPGSPYVYPGEEVSYATAGHTNELVNLAATGAAARTFLKLRGTWYPGPILDNTQINAALRRSLGLPSR